MSRQLSPEAELSREGYYLKNPDSETRERLTQPVPVDLDVYDVMSMILMIDDQIIAKRITVDGAAAFLDFRAYLAEKYTEVTGKKVPPVPPVK